MSITPKRAATILVNPIAGQAGRPEAGARQLAQILATHHWQVRLVRVPNRAAMATEAARAAAQGQTVVFVAGGDGSYRAAAQGLVGTATALGPLPLGSRNVLAQRLGLRPPRGPRWLVAWRRQAQILAQAGFVYTHDVGLVNDQVFLSWAGIGFDAAVVHHLEGNRQAPRGQVVGRYTWAIVRLLHHWPGFRALEPPTPEPQWMWLVFKEPRYAGGLVRIQAAIRPDDGRLALWRIPGRGVRGLLWALWAWGMGHWRGQTPGLQDLAIPQTWRLRTPQPVHLDGDPLLYTDALHWQIRPRGLRLWGPRPRR